MNCIKNQTWFMSLICLYMLLFLSALSLSASSYSLRSNSPWIKIARGFVGIKEKGNNRGYWIDLFNKPYNNIGGPYCTTFWDHVLDSANVKVPWKKSGLARSFVQKGTVSNGIYEARTFTAWDVIIGKEEVEEGDFLTWQKGTTRNGHEGCASKDWDKIKGMTIQANTSSGIKGSQDNGDGIYEKMASITPGSFLRIKWVTRLRKV